ncbi:MULTISPECIES: CaiB/BaiF CoA transferase family protein [unclassified Xanthobacter]|uniref:CaiB/BaiF CoA transferase family protein n=1 Tax=unclassified Xanthobacter TaxID=2623496 RepID=UPI001EDF6433|nr:MULTISPECIES: CoA transferase [unclassified Xanthobacter]
MTRPFEGVRILDFTRFFAGPFGTYQFALLGADVIKIEPIEGEENRRAQLSQEWADRNMAPAFVAVNANKRCMTLDLRKPEAREIILRLAAEADVVWENFRPGVMDRFGLGYEELSKINPQLIYCAVSGFGQSGPESGAPAFDGKVQAMSGIMSITGNPSDGPMRAGFAVCDLIGGITAAFAVSSALYQRTHTGKGQFVDVAMLDSTLNVLAQHVTEYTMTGYVQRQYGNLSVTRKVTADRFRCGNGHIVLAVLLEKQFANLMRALGREDALADPRFKDWPTRTRHAAELRDIIEDAMRDGDPQGWEQRLTAADVPCATIHSLDDILNHPQVHHREQLQTVPSAYGPLTLVGPGFRLAHGSGRVERAPGQVGEHTDEILAEYGFAPTDIARWREARVI